MKNQFLSIFDFKDTEISRTVSYNNTTIEQLIFIGLPKRQITSNHDQNKICSFIKTLGIAITTQPNKEKIKFTRNKGICKLL